MDRIFRTFIVQTAVDQCKAEYVVKKELETKGCLLGKPASNESWTLQKQPQLISNLSDLSR